MLRESPGRLVDDHDLVMLDLDGVVYVGGAAVDGVAAVLEQVRAARTAIAFITNNASRTPAAVAELLTSLGVAAAASDVVTSAQAAARLVVERWGSGHPVAVLGAEGLWDALRDAGLRPVTVDGPECGSAVALVSGYDPDVVWRQVMRAAALVRDGLPYVAANADWTIPTASGREPGHGVLVRTISDFAGVAPVVAGKPQRPLLDETVRRMGGRDPLMVGDRLDTDIAGASALGIGSLLVMTGVTWVEELVRAEPHERPTQISAGLDGLLAAHPVPTREPAGWRVGGWMARAVDGRVELRGGGSPDDWWRALAASAWAHLDETGRPVDAAGLEPPVTAR